MSIFDIKKFWLTDYRQILNVVNKSYTNVSMIEKVTKRPVEDLDLTVGSKWVTKSIPVWKPGPFPLLILFITEN